MRSIVGIALSFVNKLMMLGVEFYSKKLSKIIDFDALTLNSLVELIVQNQKLLRRPLVVDEHRLQVGYNEDDIRKFLPRKVRQLGLITAIENVRIWDQAK